MSKQNAMDENELATGFSESWLTLREPADHAARSTRLDEYLVAWFKQQDTHHVLELGAGTGSNLRYLMPQLGHDQDWLLLDNDAALFARLPEIMQLWSTDNNASFHQENDAWHIKHATFSACVRCEVIDLANQLEQISTKGIQLLTASALLDLTSEKWLDNIARIVFENQCACLFALNYNGSVSWQPAIDSDETIRALLNEHQLNDKGFGEALGPCAGQYFAHALAQHGRQVKSDNSNWVIKPESYQLLTAIIDGWAPAALDQNNSAREYIAQWHTTRKQAINTAVSTLTVGHIDVLSLPE